MKQDSQMFGTEKISKILWNMAPPVMLAQLIQALYNIVDSFFVGRYSESGLTALSIIYPIQLLMIAFAVGTGVGINTCMAHYLGLSEDEKADEIGGIGTPLTLFMWTVFAVFCYFFMPAYAKMSTDSAEVIKEVVMYGRIVCVFSFGLFLESIWTKILQANGDMKTPMIAQIAGYKHHTRSTLDFWYVWIAEDGNRRSCGSNRRWSDRSGADRHAQRIPEVTGVICISAGHPQDL